MGHGAEDDEDPPVRLHNRFNEVLCIRPVQKCACVHKHLYRDLQTPCWESRPNGRLNETIALSLRRIPFALKKGSRKKFCGVTCQL